MLLFFIVLVVLFFCIVGIFIWKGKFNNIVADLREGLELAGLPFVIFKYKNKYINLLLDTGSTISLLDSSVYEHEEDSDNDVVSIHGIGEVVDCTKHSVILERDKHKFKVDVLVNDYSKSFNTTKDITGIIIHGILGMNFLKKYNSVFDLGKEKITFKNGRRK